MLFPAVLSYFTYCKKITISRYRVVYHSGTQSSKVIDRVPYRVGYSNLRI